ncbi:MAG: AAA family ATPase, partial [Gammaproteobacteria bacterium]|nr:AAA family ATPase [Gammaproteobacteria bacterium]
KPVTMLFADIVGSTAMTENLDAEETHELLYGATRRMADAVESNQGTICRLMGDGIMAMFGAPVASERHALEACRAALEMQSKIADSGIQIRVGLDSGEVVVLEVGDDPEKPEYDASGPTVPLAARMEQSAQPGTILITATALALAGELVEVSKQPTVMVKGISQPVVVHRLHKVHSAAELSPLSTRSPFVGRRAELAQFRGLLEVCLESGHGQTVFVRGEAGIGKTRFVEEMVLLAQDRGYALHKALVLDFGTGKGQEAIPALIRGFFNIGPGCGKGERELALDQAEHEGIAIPEQRVYLNDLLDLTQPLELRTLYDAMDADARNKGKCAAVTDTLTRLAARKQIFIVVEDLHWADGVTLEQLASLTEAVAECPALMVITSRTDGDPIDSTWRARAGESPIVTWDLGPLRQDESIKLVTAFIDTNDELARRCIERAAGNPLFLEQLLLSVGKSGSESIPESIKSLVLARLDHLPAEDKQAVRAAAVLGQRFEIEALRYLIDNPDYQCRGLVEHHLVRPEGTLFLFAHALIQGGSYGSMIKPQRADLHRRAAEWYTERDPVLHAEHLDHARDDRAPNAYLRAAQMQSGQYRPERALLLVQRGLEIARQSDRFELNCLEGELLRILWNLPKSIAAFRVSVELASDDIERCRAWVGLAENLGITQSHEELIEVLKHAEEVAKMHALSLKLAQIHRIRGGAHFFRGEIDACLKSNKISLEYAREANAPEAQAQALSGLGDAEYNRGRFISSYRYFDLCIKLAREHGFGRVIAANLSMRGYVSQWQNDLEATTADYHAAVEQATRTHDLRAEMLALVGGGAFWAATGDPVEGEKWLRRGLSITHRLGSRLFEGEYYYLLGRIAIQQGDRQQARKFTQTAVDILRESESGLTFGGPIALGVLALALEDPDQRHQALAEAEELLETGSVGHNYLVFYEDAMEVSLEMEQWDEADRYAQALEDYTRAETLPRCDFFISRGRALAAHGRGKQDHKTEAELRRLLDEAGRAGLIIALSALEAALAAN